MAAEPINIFSHKQDVAGIAALLRQMEPSVVISGSDDAWERITIEGTKSWFRKAPRLVFKNAPEYYSGPDWPNQVAGMQGYFSRFPDAPCKPNILRLIGSFRFALAIEFDPDLYLESNDPRLKLLFATAAHLDGVLFTPSGLWDATGRPLLCADGRADAAAVLPGIPPPEENFHPSERPEELAEPERIPPDAQRVARRALCLAALAGRGLLEMEQMPRERAEEQRKRLLSWIGELALEDEIEPKELDLLRQPVGTLLQQATVDAGWRLEGLGVLAWALGQFELPAYDQLVDPGILLPAVGFLDLNQATTLLASPTLRSPEELSSCKTNASLCTGDFAISSWTRSQWTFEHLLRNAGSVRWTFRRLDSLRRIWRLAKRPLPRRRTTHSRRHRALPTSDILRSTGWCKVERFTQKLTPQPEINVAALFLRPCPSGPRGVDNTSWQRSGVIKVSKCSSVSRTNGATWARSTGHQFFRFASIAAQAASAFPRRI